MNEILIASQWKLQGKVWLHRHCKCCKWNSKQNKTKHSAIKRKQAPAHLSHCHMKATKTIIFPVKGRKVQEILWTLQVSEWWNSPLLTAGAGKRSQAGRSLKEWTRSVFTPFQINVTQGIHCTILQLQRRENMYNSYLFPPITAQAHSPWLWGSKDSHAYLSRVWACSGNSFWGGGFIEKHKSWIIKTVSNAQMWNGQCDAGSILLAPVMQYFPVHRWREGASSL